jgi:hypothetical protein
MPEGEMMDFTQALAELQMSESELQNLIARGDLRAFRSAGTMKFRRADVDKLKQERATEPTIIIPAADASQLAFGGGGTKLNLDVPQDLGVDESAATVVPETTPGGAAPTVDLGSSGSGTEEIVFEDSDLDIMPLADASAATADVTVAAEEPVTVPLQAAEEPRPSRRKPAEEAAAVAAPARRTAAVYAKEPASPIMTAILIVTCVVSMFVGSILTVVLWKDTYNEKLRTRYVPEYLKGVVESAKDWGEPETN